MPVRKSDAAIILGLSKARISQLVAKGLPVDQYGMIDIDAARAWIERHIDPSRRVGWHETRGLARPGNSAPPGLPASPAATGDTDRHPAMMEIDFPTPGQRGFALAVTRVLRLLPLATVAAVAEAGGTREVAKRVADLLLIGMWELLDEDARELGFPAFQRGGAEVFVMDKDILRWPEKVIWDDVFPSAAEAEQGDPEQGEQLPE